MMSIMIALAAAVALGVPAPGGDRLFNNTDGSPLAAQTDYNNNSAPRAETQKGINPVQHSE